MNAIDANKVVLGKIDKETIKAKMYKNVENVIIDDVPEEFGVGASAVNLNKKERLSKVLVYLQSHPHFGKKRGRGWKGVHQTSFRLLSQ